MSKILFVEDDEEYRKTMAKTLKNENYEVDEAGSAMEAMGLIAVNEYDLVISDLMMENVDGLELLEYIKRAKPYIKTAILTAEPTMDTEFESLNLHVNKYLVKGMRMDVFLKHIEILLEETTGIEEKKNFLTSKSDNIMVDLYRHEVKKNGEFVKLTAREFSLLKFLLENKNKALTRDEILEGVWDVSYSDVEERAVDVQIKELRKKLKVTSISSIRGYGYKWVDNA